MNILVVGMGHFAGVVASCLYQRGFAIKRTDKSPFLYREGQRLAEDEPGYSAPPIGGWSADGRCDLVWIAYDCPLDSQGYPLTDEIVSRIREFHREWPIQVPCIVSCQWPVGTLARIESLCPDRRFVYVMENVRVGQAITDFLNQSTTIVGTRGPLPGVVRELLSGLSPMLIEMSPESAEMTKHTTNAFMALQIAFINEIAEICEQVDANPHEVAMGLMSDRRVSAHAPLQPGRPFGGGSLQRDLMVVEQLVGDVTDRAPILTAIRMSNDGGKRDPSRKKRWFDMTEHGA